MERRQTPIEVTVELGKPGTRSCRTSSGSRPASRAKDLRCGIVGKDGKSHAEHGMVGKIIIE